MMTRPTTLLLAILSAGLSAPAARADVIIDGFTAGVQTLNNADTATTVSAGLAVPGVLGGARTLFIVHGIRPAASVLAVSPSLGELVFDSQGTGNATRFLIKYDGTTGGSLNATGLGGLNVAGGTAIQFDAFNLTTGPVLVSLRFYTDATSFSEKAVVVSSGADSKLVVPFSGFSPGPGAANPADFGKLGALTVQIDYALGQGGNGRLRSLSFVTGSVSVPEPSPAVLGSLTAVLAGVVAWARGRRGA